jgi:hypothetical protein
MYLNGEWDPFRQAEWRWEKARWLRENGMYARKGVEDAGVIMAKEYQAKEAACRNNSEREYLFRKYPGIYTAKEIFRRPEKTVRWMIEAYLLARATPTEIYDATSVKPETVIWYERLFYNVTPYLKHDSYISNVVIGTIIQHGIMERDFDGLWKLIGYAAGPTALREWLKILPEYRITDVDQFNGVCEAWYSRMMARKAFLAALTIPVYNNQMAIFESWARCKEVARQSGQDQESVIHANISMSLNSLPFSVGKGGPTHLPLLAAYDEGSVELRAHEQIEISMGFETEEHRKLLTMKFPEPKEVVPLPAPDAGGQ